MRHLNFKTKIYLSLVLYALGLILFQSSLAIIDHTMSIPDLIFWVLQISSIIIFALLFALFIKRTIRIQLTPIRALFKALDVTNPEDISPLKDIPIPADNGSVKRLINAYNKLSLILRKSLVNDEAHLQIGRALTTEKNSYILFHTILYYSKKIAGADAGSIFLVETYDDSDKRLRFKYSNTFSKNLPYEEFTIPLTPDSIAGFVASTGQTLNIPDVYHIDESSPYSFNKSFDQNNDYRTKSMLAVPMKDHHDKIIGVLQLINCKLQADSYTGEEAYSIKVETEEETEAKTSPFPEEIQILIESISSEAAVALDNARMHNQIKEQFEEFVRASVTAIESRDPATSGHSERVAGLSCKLAESISFSINEPFSQINFDENKLKELEYAALMHDFGKIYIDPGIFLKGKRLFETEMSYLKLRIKYLRILIENDFKQNIVGFVMQGIPVEKELVETLKEDQRERLVAIETALGLIDQLNDPNQWLDDRDGIIEQLLSISRSLEVIDHEKAQIPLLTESEIVNLKIPKGTLNPNERKVIESHVEHSYTFVKQIPWPEEYCRIPEIILNHHEMLDGSGYPKGRKGVETIPLESRILAVADIFDALRAADRPYKKAIPIDKVLHILNEEAEAGRLDKDLVSLFLKEKIYENF